MAVSDQGYVQAEGHPNLGGDGLFLLDGGIGNWESGIRDDMGLVIGNRKSGNPYPEGVKYNSPGSAQRHPGN